MGEKKVIKVLRAYFKNLGREMHVDPMPFFDAVLKEGGSAEHVAHADRLCRASVAFVDQPAYVEKDGSINTFDGRRVQHPCPPPPEIPDAQGLVVCHDYYGGFH